VNGLLSGQKMDDVGIWNRKDKYHPPEDIEADGDIIEIKISFKGQKVEPNCWCMLQRGWESSTRR